GGPAAPGDAPGGGGAPRGRDGGMARRWCCGTSVDMEVPLMAMNVSPAPAPPTPAPAQKVSLLIADVDGTLVTKDKILTERAQKAVRRLHEVGIAFAITSGRPPRGMSILVAPICLSAPVSAFNWSLFVH